MINNPMQMIPQVINYINGYKGNAEAEVRGLVSSGKMSQAQLNSYQQTATQILNILKTMK